jgi:hypothetical protein
MLERCTKKARCRGTWRQVESQARVCGSRNLAGRQHSAVGRRVNGASGSKLAGGSTAGGGDRGLKIGTMLSLYIGAIILAMDRGRDNE